MNEETIMIKSDTPSAYVFHYDVFKEYNATYMADILTSENIKDTVHWKPLRVGADGRATPLPQMLLLRAEYNGKNILLPFTFVSEEGETLVTEEHLPIKIIDMANSETWSYQGKVYKYCPDIMSVEFQDVKTVDSFRSFVDTEYCVYQHSSPLDYLLFRLMILAAWNKRVYFRVATAPSFGKNSAIDLISKLRADAVVFTPDSLPALYPRFTNRILALNEICDLPKDIMTVVKRFVQDGADGTTYFERPKVDMQKGKTKYDISNLSVPIFYNRVCDLREGSKKKELFFDWVFDNKHRNRVMPFCFMGSLTQRFPTPRDSKAEYKAQRKNMLDIQKNLGYYKHHLQDELHSWNTVGFLNGTPNTRWAETFDKLLMALDAYAQTQEEFSYLEAALIRRHKAYFKMLADEPRAQEDGTLTFETDYGFDDPAPPSTLGLAIKTSVAPKSSTGTQSFWDNVSTPIAWK